MRPFADGPQAWLANPGFFVYITNKVYISYY